MKSILQTPQWEEFRKSRGWGTYRVDDILVLKRKLLLGKAFLYSPEISYLSLRSALAEKQSDILKIATSRYSIGARDDAIFYRIDFLDEFSEEKAENLKKLGFIKSFEEVQPEWRQVVDISGSEEEILAQMKPKGRYNIKVAQKHGVTVEKSENIDDFYKIFSVTAKRDGFEIRPKQYFEKMFEILSPNGLAQLLVSRLPTTEVVDNGGQGKYNNTAIAAEIITFYDGVASYLYGASSNEYRNTMAPYLMHWEAIKRAKKKGCKTYDLLAIEPADGLPSTDYSNNNGSRSSVVGKHKYSGITRFKEQFGGRKVHLMGAWDLVYKPTWYKLFKYAESYRRH